MSRSVLKTLYVTEKASVLSGLVENTSNPCVAKCKTAKYVFLVEPDANKVEIKKAVEEAYKDQKIRVLKVNTITLPRKQKRSRGQRKMGTTSIVKKAVVTLHEGDQIDFER